MIQDRSFIVFSDDWGRHPFSCQHIMKRFVPYNRILWVNTIGMRYPHLNIYDIKRGWEKILSWTKSDTSPQDKNKPIVISPFMLPYNNVKLIRRLNKISVVQKVKKMARESNIKDPILLTTLPNCVDYIGEFNETLAVYYCVDEFSKWPGVAKRLVEKMEKELIEKVDLIIATSDELQSRKKNSRCPTYLLPHGVDVEHFSQYSEQRCEIPATLINIPRPILGFFGLFDDRINQDILMELAKTTGYSIVIIGTVMTDISCLKKIKNVFFLGPVNYEDLPRYVASFNVCLLPYKINPLTININPLKLKEYIASGKPVVATGLPEAVKFKNLIAIASEKDEFIEKVKKSLHLKVNQPDLRNYLMMEDWTYKAKQMSMFIENTIERKLVNKTHG